MTATPAGAAHVLARLAATLRRGFASAFAGLAAGPAAPGWPAAAARLGAQLDALVVLLRAEQDARRLLWPAPPDTSFGSADLLWAARRVRAELRRTCGDPACSPVDELLEHLALLHAEVLVALHAKRHEVAPWLAGADPTAAAAALVACYGEVLEQLECPDGHVSLATAAA